MSENPKPEMNHAKQQEPKTKKASTKKSSRAKREASAALAPWRFPKSTLEDALRVAKAIDDKYAGNPTKAADLVKAVGFNKETDWRFLDLLKSSALYGLTSGTGQTATVRLEKLGEDILSPGSSVRSAAAGRSRCGTWR
jgi:hypothetical protein